MGSGRPRSRRLALLAAPALLLVLSGTAAAAVTTDGDETRLPAAVVDAAKPAVEGASEDGGGSIVRLVVGFAIVIVVIAGLTWLVRTWSRSRGVKTDARLSVVATTVLAQDRALHLVRVGDEMVLVGSAANGVTPIRVYDADEARHLDDLMGASPVAPFGFGRGVGGRGGIDSLRKLTAR